MKRLALALTLACVLSSAALAGDVPSTGNPAPGDVPSTGTPAPGQTSADEDPGDVPSTGICIWLTIIDLAF